MEKKDSQTEEPAVATGQKSYTVQKKLSMIAKCNQNGGNSPKLPGIATSHVDAYNNGVLCSSMYNSLSFNVMLVHIKGGGL